MRSDAARVAIDDRRRNLAEERAELMKEIALLRRAVMFVSEKLTHERRIDL